MFRRLLTASALVAVVLLGTGPATDAGSGSGQNVAASVKGEPPLVVTAAPTLVGRVLFAQSGQALHALYVRSFDWLTGPNLPLHSTCFGTCAVAWPPLLAPGPNGPFVAGGGVQLQDLGTVPYSANGVTEYQVTYFGQPLYEFVRDTAPLDINGENVGAFNTYWHLVAIDGRPDAGIATVTVEASPYGTVLSTPTAFSTHRSLYMLTFDTPSLITCVQVCTAIWPPLITTSQPVVTGSGVSAAGIGTLQRPDGTLQVTYFGHPVYLFAFDLAAGAPSGLTNGEYLVDQFQHGVWYLIAPSGMADPGPVSIASMTSSFGTILAVNPPSPYSYRPFAVYAFSADTATASNCTGSCARFWPPVLTSEAPTAASGSGVDQADLSDIVRPDGTLQVEYFGHPLYFFAFDQPGQTLGEGKGGVFGGTFQVVSLSGMPE